MRIFSFISVLLASIGCYSASKYKSELFNFPELKPRMFDDFEIYEIKEYNLNVAVKFQFKKLDLKFTNNSQEAMTYLPLDLNLGTTENRCSIKEIYEVSGKKVNFETKYTIEKNTTVSFKYKFSCEKNPEAFVTINGLKQKDKKIILNFRFLKN